MKSILAILLLVLPICTFAERIVNFASDINIQRDGSILVNETIIYDFESNEKRGIYRTIPQGFAVGQEKRDIVIELVGVTRDNQEDEVKITNTGGDFTVRVGDPDVYISGKHSYQITYQVHGALRYFDEFDELYWNVTGDQWQVPIDQWQFRLNLAQGTEAVRHSCYTGTQSSTVLCDIKSDQNDTRTYFGSGGLLQSGEQVTFAIAFTPDVVEEVIFVHKGNNPYAFGVLAIIVFCYSRFVWMINRRHYKKQSIITQYDAPEGFSALFSGYVIDGQLQGRDIAAGLIELAQQGYIMITQKGSDTWLSDYNYDLTLLKVDVGDLTKPQRYLLELFFDAPLQKDSVYNTKTGEKMSFNKVEVLRSKMDNRSIQLNLREQVQLPLRQFLLACVAVGFALFWVFRFDVTQSVMYVIWVVTSLVLFVITGVAVGRKTVKGYQAINHLKGLYRYIDVAEKSRIDFHDAPEKNPETFSRYLPFAVAFGLEKQWVKEFEDIMVPQDWLVSQQGNLLDSTGVAAAVSGVSNSLSSQVSTASSGSGGGGFSGGGAGGGGGGSW